MAPAEATIEWSVWADLGHWWVPISLPEGRYHFLGTHYIYMTGFDSPDWGTRSVAYRDCRYDQGERLEAVRHELTVGTPFGRVRVKLGQLDGQRYVSGPEYRRVPVPLELLAGWARLHGSRRDDPERLEIPLMEDGYYEACRVRRESVWQVLVNGRSVDPDSNFVSGYLGPRSELVLGLRSLRDASQERDHD